MVFNAARDADRFIMNPARDNHETICFQTPIPLLAGLFVGANAIPYRYTISNDLGGGIVRIVYRYSITVRPS